MFKKAALYESVSKSFRTES